MVARDVIRLEYTNCSAHAAVVLYTIRGGVISGPAASRCPNG